MRRKKGYISIMLAVTLLAGLFSSNVSMAAKKVKLSVKKITVTVGKTKTLKLKNNKKKVKWSVISGKKYVKLKNKKKTSVEIQGKKAGKAKIQAKVGKKKYVCKVTVKKKKISSAKKDDPGKKPVTTPVSDPIPTPEPTTSDKTDQIREEVVSLELSANRELLFEKNVEDELLPEQYLSTWLRDNDLILTINIIYKNAVQTITTTLCESSKEVIPQGMVIGCKNGEITVQYKEKKASLKIEYVESKREGDYSYITNGKVSHITGYSGKNEGSVVIPDTIGGALVTDMDINECGDTGEDVKISELTLPKELHDTGMAFRYWHGWENLRAIHTKEGAKNLKAVDGVLFDKTLSTLICYPMAKENESYTVPSTVITIREFAFRNNNYLKRLSLPAGLSAYGSNFSAYSESDAIELGISNLEEIEVADGNPYIMARDGVLYDKKMEIMRCCPPGRKKQTLEVPEGVKIIAHHAMQGVAIDKLILPTTLTTFEYQSSFFDAPAPAHIYINKDCLTEEEWSYVWYYGMNFMPETIFHVKSQRMYDFLKTIWDDDYVFPNKISTDYNW